MGLEEDCTRQRKEHIWRSEMETCFRCVAAWLEHRYPRAQQELRLERGQGHIHVGPHVRHGFYSKVGGNLLEIF